MSLKSFNEVDDVCLVVFSMICGQIRLIEIMEPARKRGGNESKVFYHAVC